MNAETVPPLPIITSAAPLENTRATHEYHRDAASASTLHIDASIGTGAELMIMARCFSDLGVAPLNARPWDGVVVSDGSGTVIADLSTIGQREFGRDPFAVCSLGLPPGIYQLQYPLPGGTRAAQSLILPAGGWRLEAYVLFRLNGPPQHPRISLLMRYIGSPWGTQEDVQLEKARVALADERPILSDELTALLVQKFNNPLAGILGGHLLLIEHEQGGRDRREWLNTVVQNLRGLVGSEHPDVEALSLACPNPTLRTTRSIVAIPMLELSWRMLVKASQDNPNLIPTSVWRDVFALMSAPPFLVWSPDAEVRREVGRQLASAAFGPAEQRSLAGDPQRELAAAPGLPNEVSVSLTLPSKFDYLSELVEEKNLSYWGGTADAAFRWLRPGVVEATPPIPAEVQSAVESAPAALAYVAAESAPLRRGAAEALGLPPSAVPELWQHYYIEP